MVGIHQALLAGYGGNGGVVLPTLNAVFLDGSEHMDQTDDKWKGGTHNEAPVSGIPGMNGKCHNDGVWGDKVTHTFPTGSSTVSFRMRVRFRVLGNEGFIAFNNGGTNHLQVELKSDGTMQVRSPVFTHVTTDVYAINTTYTVEFRATIDNASGSYRLKVNDVVPNKSGGGTMDQSGLDTQGGATATVNVVQCGNGVTIDTYTDDHVIDWSGNDIGASQVETLYPDGAGDLTEMTPSAGNNFQCVDEATQNADTDFVSNAASSKRDCYTFQNRSVVGTPRVVQVTTMVKLTSGTPTFKNFLRIGGANHDGTITHTATSAYKAYVECWNVNPATGLAWTDSDINSLQAGIFAVDANLRMTQIVLEILVAT
jgi:hypothetical protein